MQMSSILKRMSEIDFSKVDLQELLPPLPGLKYFTYHEDEKKYLPNNHSYREDALVSLQAQTKRILTKYLEEFGINEVGVQKLCERHITSDALEMSERTKKIKISQGCIERIAADILDSIGISWIEKNLPKKRSAIEQDGKNRDLRDRLSVIDGEMKSLEKSIAQCKRDIRSTEKDKRHIHENRLLKLETDLTALRIERQKGETASILSVEDRQKLLAEIQECTKAIEIGSLQDFDCVRVLVRSELQEKVFQHMMHYIFDALPIFIAIEKETKMIDDWQKENNKREQVNMVIRMGRNREKVAGVVGTGIICVRIVNKFLFVGLCVAVIAHYGPKLISILSK